MSKHETDGAGLRDVDATVTAGWEQMILSVGQAKRVIATMVSQLSRLEAQLMVSAQREATLLAVVRAVAKRDPATMDSDDDVICFYCDSDIGSGEPHYSECLYEQARAVLAAIEVEASAAASGKEPTA